MIQLAEPEGLAAEGGRRARGLTASHSPLTPGKPKQRSAEIKKQRGINNKEGGEMGREGGSMGVRPALLFKKVTFCSFHFRMNHLPLSGPSQSKFKQPFGNQHQVFLFFSFPL